MKKFAEDCKDIYAQIDRAAINWSQGFSQSLADMALTGKASFSDFALQVVNDLIRIMIQAQITEPFLRAVTQATGWGGITPGGGGEAPAGKATGGPVMKGSTYLVGENGPELFRASNSGSITPNNQLGGNTVVNIYSQPGETAETRTRSTPQGDVVEVFMKQIDSHMNEQISRGQGLARTLEGRYSLTRKAY